MFLDHYSLVVKILFPGHGVDGSRHQRKTWERGDSLGSRLSSAEVEFTDEGREHRKGTFRAERGLTPAEEVVPVQMLLLGEHGHHDERVQVDAFTQHPEVVAAQHVHVEEMQHFTAHLQRVGSQAETPTRRVNHTPGRRGRNTGMEDVRTRGFLHC